MLKEMFLHGSGPMSTSIDRFEFDVKTESFRSSSVRDNIYEFDPPFGIKRHRDFCVRTQIRYLDANA